MKHRRVEKHPVPQLQRQRDVVLPEERPEVFPPPREVPRLIALAEGEEARGPTARRHVAVRDGPLQREILRGEVQGAREAGGGDGVLKAEVVVAVGFLGGAAGFDDVDLGCDAVGGAQPGLGDEAQPGVGVVRYKRAGVQEGVLAEGVPDAVVFAAGGEVVAFLCCGEALLSDDVGEGLGGGCQGWAVAGWVVHAFKHDDAGPGVEGVVPFVLEIGGEFPVEVVKGGYIVDGDVLLNA
ncbi:hypothetical protein CNMCM6936_004923 [Aspergillus lentulus]|nr:hypothetical protein CNMCM6936_004923 [Aspergillus lentulus]